MARMRILESLVGPCWSAPAWSVGAGAVLRRLATAVVMVVAVVAVSLATGPAARAASLIRDAEIERTIRAYAAPLLRSAGIAPESITIRLLNDPTVNAFVTRGRRMFFHTGLVMKTERAEELIGVIAHETGHIAGGHLVRMGENAEDYSIASMLTTLLGAAAGALAGRPDVGAAVMLGGQGAIQRGFLAYNRTEEASADAFALKALDREGVSAEGLRDFLDTLQDQEALTTAYRDPYLLTHPLTRDRLSAVEAHVERSPTTGHGVSPEWQDMFDRMRAKLFAFLRPPQETLTRYKDQTGVAADYARAIAYYRALDLDRALDLAEQLIATEPDNPFFEELAGQMLFERSRVSEALPHYERAVALAPEEPLLRIALSHAQLESGDPALLKPAEDNLRNALARDDSNALGWQLLAQVYGRTDQSAMADYAMAETALRSGDYDRALFHVGRAQDQVPRGSPTWLRLQDIESEARRLRKE